jgi:hypothetical protein
MFWASYVCDTLDLPSGPGQEDWMPFTMRLERADGTPAEPPTIHSAVTNWRTGDTIPLGRERALRVVGIVVTNEDEPPVLIVEDVAEGASSAEL